MRRLMLPMAVVLAPQIALATMQQGLSVLAPAFTATAGLPPEAVGLIGGLGGLGSLWFFAASEAIMPGLGPVRALQYACLLAVVAAVLIGIGLPATIFAGAPLIGFAYAVTAPAGSQILAEHTPRRLWGTLFSLRQAGVPAGGAIAGLLGAGLASALAWQVGLGALAALPLGCAALLAAAPAQFRSAPLAGRPRLSAVAAPGNLLRPFRIVRQRPDLVRLSAASMGFAAVQGATFTFLTTYLTTGLGVAFGMAGALYSVMQVASVGSRVGIGFLSDRLGPPRRTLTGLAVASATGAVLLSAATPGLPAWALLAGAAYVGVTVASWNGLFLAEIAGAAGDRVAEATSAVTFFTFASYMVAPLLFAALSYGAGYRVAFLSVACCALASAVLLARAPAPADPGLR